MTFLNNFVSSSKKSGNEPAGFGCLGFYFPPKVLLFKLLNISGNSFYLENDKNTLWIF